MDTWFRTYRPLYGELATAELAAQQEEFERIAPASPEEAAGRYREAIDARARHTLGEYFTPRWLAGLVLDRLEYTGQAALLDPSAGLGGFVEQAAARDGTAIGYEVNPVTSRCARAMGLAVETRDTLNDPGERRFEVIAGNPPWVNWRHIHAQYRERIAPLWKHYALAPEGRLGGAMDDLSILFTYVCADRLLAPGGRMGLLLPRTLFQSAGGGRRFRRFELPGGRYLRVLSVEEIRGSTAFTGAATQPVLAIFDVAASPTLYPVAYFREGEQWHATPVSSDPASAWAVTRTGTPAAPANLRGHSAYAGRVGAHSGGASGVFWVDVLDRRGDLVTVRNRSDAGRNQWPEVTAELEAEFVRPLVRGRDVSRWCALPSCAIVLPHHPSGRAVSLGEMAERWPGTFAYFETFREQMLLRPHYLRHFKAGGQPYWSMYNVGPYTFAPHRVVWREQSSTLECAVLQDADWVADAKLTVAPCASDKEAHYLAAMLNCRPARAFVEAYALPTQISTHVLRNLRVPRFQPDEPSHRELVQLSRECHRARADLAPEQLDAAASSAYGLT